MTGRTCRVLTGLLGFTLAAVCQALAPSTAHALEWSVSGRSGLEAGTSAWDPLSGSMGVDLTTWRPWLTHARARVLADLQIDCVLTDWLELRGGLGGRLVSGSFSGSSWNALGTVWCEAQAIALPGDVDLTVAYSHRNTIQDQLGHTIWALLEKPTPWGAVVFLDAGHDWNFSSDASLTQFTPFSDLGITRRLGPWGTRVSLALGGSLPGVASGGTGLGLAATAGLSQVVLEGQVFWLRLRLDGFSTDLATGPTWGPSAAIGTAWIFP